MYIVLYKTKREEMWIEAGRRAVRFEEKNRMRSYKIILTECMTEMEIRERQGKESRLEDR